MKTQDEYRNENDTLRELFKATFPDLAKITQTEIHKLLWILDSELDAHYQAGGLRMCMVPLNGFVAKMIREKGLSHKGLELKVSSHYFNGREGISFLKDGRVFFCGWAGGNNHEPFQKGFRKWLESAEGTEQLLQPDTSCRLSKCYTDTTQETINRFLTSCRRRKENEAFRYVLLPRRSKRWVLFGWFRRGWG